MIACFFGYTGHVTTALEDRRTVNTDWYTTIYLPEVINELSITNRNRRIILHHDNASCHTACQTVDLLSNNNVELMTYCSYSPDEPKIGSSVCKNVSILKANTSKNNKAIY